MVAFSATLVGFLLILVGVTIGNTQLIIIAIVFALINGYIAFRGISGSTMTAIAINVIQLTALVIFSVLAIVYRLTHPEIHYVHSTIFSVITPHSMTNLIYQSTIA